MEKELENLELQIEIIDSEIKRLLETLDEYSEFYKVFGSEFEEEWYWVDMEAKVSIDRETAKRKLEEFILIVKEKVKEYEAQQENSKS